MSTTLIKNGIIVTPGKIIKGDILIVDEKIQRIEESIQDDADHIIDANSGYILPGGIDAHTHLDMPVMNTKSNDNFESGTTAAIFGGTTTIIDFANQERGETLGHTLNKWMEKAQNNSLIDFAFHMTVTDINKTTKAEIKQLVEERGITSFKTFTTYDSMKITANNLGDLMNEVGRQGGIITCHAEDDKIITNLIKNHTENNNLSPAFHPLTRPNTAEAKAVEEVISLAKENRCPLYIVHMSTKEATKIVENARAEKLPIFSETCTQYLTLDDSKYQNEEFIESAKFIMSPPLRSKEDQEKLWQGLKNGTVQVVATDHCPFTTEQKSAGKDSFTRIPGGIPGIENRMEIIFSEGVSKNRIDIETFAKVTAENPARIFGLFPQKGALQEGADADIIIIDPNIEHTISVDTSKSNCDYSPYEGMELKGKITKVIHRGEIAIENNQLKIKKGFGRYLKRERPNLKF